MNILTFHTCERIGAPHDPEVRIVFATRHKAERYAAKHCPEGRCAYLNWGTDRARIMGRHDRKWGRP